MMYGYWSINPTSATFYEIKSRDGRVRITGFCSVDKAKRYIDKYYLLAKGEVRDNPPAPWRSKRELSYAAQRIRDRVEAAKWSHAD